MPVIYQTDMATSDRQDVGNDSLAQLLAAFQTYAGNATEPQEIAALNSIISILNTLSTSANTAAVNASIQALSGLVATGAKQDAALAVLQSILAANNGLATSAKQDTGNASLASLDGKTASSSAAITSLSVTAASQVVLAANANRKGFYVYNNSAKKAFIAFAGSSSQSAFTVLVPANSGWESAQLPIYSGAVSVIFDAAGTGSLQITELT